MNWIPIDPSSFWGMVGSLASLAAVAGGAGTVVYRKIRKNKEESEVEYLREQNRTMLLNFKGYYQDTKDYFETVIEKKENEIQTVTLQYEQVIQSKDDQLEQVQTAYLEEKIVLEEQLSQVIEERVDLEAKLDVIQRKSKYELFVFGVRVSWFWLIFVVGAIGFVLYKLWIETTELKKEVSSLKEEKNNS